MSFSLLVRTYAFNASYETVLKGVQNFSFEDKVSALEFMDFFRKSVVILDTSAHIPYVFEMSLKGSDCSGEYYTKESFGYSEETARKYFESIENE